MNNYIDFVKEIKQIIFTKQLGNPWFKLSVVLLATIERRFFLLIKTNKFNDLKFNVNDIRFHLKMQLIIS